MEPKIRIFVIYIKRVANSVFGQFNRARKVAKEKGEKQSPRGELGLDRQI